MSLPIAPLGLGVGQVAFSVLFTAMGAPSAAFGAAIVTGVQIVNVALNLVGVFFFVTYKNEVAQSLASETKVTA
jgi:hypothetical protein